MSIRDFIQRKSPEILTGFGLAGLLGAIPLAVIGTVKACKLVEAHKKRTKKAVLEKKEVVKITWKCYIPTAISMAAGTACVICGGTVNQRRNKALATALSLSESALRTYQEKVIETIGEKKEQAVRDEISKDRLMQSPVVNKEVIITGKGDTLCYDPVSDRYFSGDIEKIRRAENELNQELYSSMYVSLSEYYYKIGLRPTSISDDLGWNIDDGPIRFDFSSQLASDDRPCLVINYHVAPRYDYKTLM